MLQRKERAALTGSSPEGLPAGHVTQSPNRTPPKAGDNVHSRWQEGLPGRQLRVFWELQEAPVGRIRQDKEAACKVRGHFWTRT